MSSHGNLARVYDTLEANALSTCITYLDRAGAGICRDALDTLSYECKARATNSVISAMLDQKLDTDAEEAHVLFKRVLGIHEVPANTVHSRSSAASHGPVV